MVEHGPVKALRWLLVAQNGWGLGHVSLQLGIAREIRRRRENDDVLILTYSEASHLISREGIACLKMPSMGQFRDAGRRALSPESQYWLVKAMVHGCVTAYRPHAVVLDTFPMGVAGQFAELLSAPAFRFLVTRENRRLSEPSQQMALRRFNLVLAGLDKGETDVPVPSGTRLEWVGQIMVRTREDALERSAARERLGLPTVGRICLVSLGGGGNPRYKEMETWVMTLARRYPEWIFAVATPPLLERAHTYPDFKGNYIR